MLSRTQIPHALKLSSILFLLTFLSPLLLPQIAHGQGLEVGGGWAFMNNNGGNGFDVDAAWWFTKQVTLAANYDGVWNNQLLGTFAFTSIGNVAVKGHLQNAIVGPRIFFSTGWTTRHKLNPFGEAQFGESWLKQSVNTGTAGNISASANCFSWELGGGAEYLLSPHWSARMNLDLLRTHFNDQGQSHLRFVLGITYTIGTREFAPSKKK